MTEPNLEFIDHFVTNPHVLFELFKNKIHWDTRMKARKTASFGISYNYSGFTYPQVKMHPSLEIICKNIKKQFGYYPNNCLLNYYENGDSSMGYHSDSIKELQQETGVAIISLGAERKISFKNKQTPELIFKYLLKNGQAIYMDQAIQIEWLHAIKKEKKVGERISLTFRHIIKNN